MEIPYKLKKYMAETIMPLLIIMKIRNHIEWYSVNHNFPQMKEEVLKSYFDEYWRSLIGSLKKDRFIIPQKEKFSFGTFKPKRIFYVYGVEWQTFNEFIKGLDDIEQAENDLKKERNMKVDDEMEKANEKIKYLEEELSFKQNTIIPYTCVSPINIKFIHKPTKGKTKKSKKETGISKDMEVSEIFVDKEDTKQKFNEDPMYKLWDKNDEHAISIIFHKIANQTPKEIIQYLSDIITPVNQYQYNYRKIYLITSEPQHNKFVNKLENTNRLEFMNEEKGILKGKYVRRIKNDVNEIIEKDIYVNFTKIPLSCQCVRYKRDNNS